MILVRCISDLPKDPTCHRQSSSGNSCPGGGYVNKQAHTLAHTRTQTNQGASKTKTEITLTHRCALPSVHGTIYSPTPSITNRAHTSSNTHTQMYEDAFIHINHTNTVTFRNTHDRFVRTYISHSPHRHVHTHS